MFQGTDDLSCRCNKTEKSPEAREVLVVWVGWAGHSNTLAACIKRATHTVTQAGKLCVCVCARVCVCRYSAVNCVSMYNSSLVSKNHFHLGFKAADLGPDPNTKSHYMDKHVKKVKINK